MNIVLETTLGHLMTERAHTKCPGRSFDGVDSVLSRDWNASRGKSPLAWERARFASRDAWGVSTRR